MSKVIPFDITRRDFAATLSAIAGATIVAGSAAGAATAALGETPAAPGAWDAYSLADLDAMHEALTKADDGMLAIYNQPRTDIEGPAGAFLFNRMDDMRRTAGDIIAEARRRKAETVDELDAQCRILARGALTVEDFAMERELVAVILARHEMARRRSAPGA